MRKLFSNSLLLLILFSFSAISCNDDGLSADYITGIYTAKKIGAQETFPLTIYNTRFNGLQVEAEWTSSQNSIPIELTDNGFKIDTNLFSDTITGNATIEDNVITIVYSLNGSNSITIVASR